VDEDEIEMQMTIFEQFRVVQRIHLDDFIEVVYFVPMRDTEEFAKKMFHLFIIFTVN